MTTVLEIAFYIFIRDSIGSDLTCKLIGAEQGRERGRMRESK